jgi:hypothetical protein
MNWGDTSAYILILGIAIVAVVLFLPNGLVSLFDRSQREGAFIVRRFSRASKRRRR